MFRSFFIQFLILFIFCFSATLFSQTFTPPEGSPLAKKEHPRLYFTEDSFVKIKAYIDNYEAAAFQEYINAVDAAYPLDPAEKNRNLLLLDAKNFAFLSYAQASGLFTNYTFVHSAKAYAQKAYAHTVVIDAQKRKPRKWLKETSHAAVMKSPSQGGFVNLALGVVYDWCFDQLTMDQKRFIADALIICYKKRDDEVDPGGKMKLGLTLTSQCHDVGIGGLTIWGDNLGDQYKAITQEMLDGVQWLWFDRVLHLGEHLFEGTAGWSEGANYFSGAVTNLTWYIAAMSSALGTNLFMEFNWLHDTPLYTYFYALPMRVEGKKSGYFQQRNDAASLRAWESLGTLKQMMPITSLIKQDDPDYAGFYRWVVEDSKYKIKEYYLGMNKPRISWLFYKFLWGYKDVEKKTPEEIGIKTSYRFGLGDAIFLSDLHTDNATKINFYTPKYHLSRHYNQDNGSFVIFKYGTLAVDAGVSKGDTHLPKSEKTGTPVFHNLLALYPPDGSTFYKYKMNSKDRADNYDNPENQPGGRNHMGTVLSQRFEDGKFDFIDYDYTRSYKGSKYAKRMRRALLYLRDPNAPQYGNEEYVIVADDAELTDGNIKKRWLLHTPSMPEIADGNWQDAGEGYWTAEKGSRFSVTNTYGNAHGKMAFTVLEPAKTNLMLRGGNEGDTYYWFTDAEGNISHERGPYSDWGGFWAGTHRLEVEDAADDSVSQFFVVLQIGDANTMTKLAAVKPIPATGFWGASINGNRAVFINRKMAAAKSLAYAFKTKVNSWHVITGLVAGEYAVKKDGKKIKTISVAADGVGFFEYKGGGEFGIVLEK